mmetsp:Transcript_9592/g.23764  ORF Transcript_9592/g.23764 Transcript_9592/m.23764 type:complete len:212 (+) Transcript_9592:516-1151(+)
MALTMMMRTPSQPASRARLAARPEAAQLLSPQRTSQRTRSRHLRVRRCRLRRSVPSQHPSPGHGPSSARQMGPSVHPSALLPQPRPAQRVAVARALVQMTAVTMRSVEAGRRATSRKAVAAGTSQGAAAAVKRRRRRSRRPSLLLRSSLAANHPATLPPSGHPLLPGRAVSQCRSHQLQPSAPHQQVGHLTARRQPRTGLPSQPACRPRRS